MFIACDMSGSYVTGDGGENWRMIHYSQLSSNIRFRAAFHPENPAVILAADGADNSWLVISKDAGRTWARLARLPAALTGELIFNLRNPRELALGAGKKTYLSADGGKTWQEAAGVRGEFLSAAFAGQEIFVGTKTGIFRSVDERKTWSQTSGNLSDAEILSFAVGQSIDGKSVILYAATSTGLKDGKLIGGVFRSENRGSTWESAMGGGLNLETKALDQWSEGEFPVYRTVLAARGKPATVYALNTSTGVPPPHHATVYRSDDAGRHWRAVFYPDPRWQPCNVEADFVVATDRQYYGGFPNGVTLSPGNPEALLWVDNGSAYCTTNGGGNWRAAHSRPAPAAPDGSPRWRCNGLVVTTTWNYYIDPHNPSRHHLCYTDIGYARSEDRGATWAWWPKAGRAPWRNTCYELAFDPAKPGRLWGAFSDVHDIPYGNIIENRHRSQGPGGIALSEDGGKSWKPLNGGLPAAPVTSITLDPRSAADKRVLYAGLFGQGVFRSDNGGTLWAAKSSGLGSAANRRVSKVFLHGDGTLFALVTALKQGRDFQPGGVGLFRSADRGESWLSVTAGQPFLWPKDFTVDPASSQVIYLGNCDANGVQSGGLYRTEDGGKTWQRLLRQGPEHVGASLMPGRPDWVFATVAEGAETSGLWLSTDRGRTFSPVAGLPFRNATRVTADPADPKVIYITTFGGSAWKGTEKP